MVTCGPARNLFYQITFLGLFKSEPEVGDSAAYRLIEFEGRRMGWCLVVEASSVIGR